MMEIIEYGESHLKDIEKILISISNNAILHKDFTLIKAGNYLSADTLRNMMLHGRIIILGEKDNLEKFLCIIEKSPALANSQAAIIKLIISNKYSFKECIKEMQSCVKEMKKCEDFIKLKIHLSNNVESDNLIMEGNLKIFEKQIYLYEVISERSEVK